MSNTSDFSKANIQGISISSDRGINSTVFLHDIVAKGGLISGTASHSNVAKLQPFITYSSHDALEADNSANCNFKILEQGAKSAFSVKEITPEGGIIYHTAIRQGYGKSIVFLSTSDPRIDPSKWIVERCLASSKPSPNFQC